MARGGDALQEVGARATGVAFLTLVAGIVLARPALVPVAAATVGALYGAELAIADAPLDTAVPAVAAGLLLSVELGYWSIEERGWSGQAGDAPRRAAFVAVLAAGAALVAAALLGLVDAVRTTSLAVDLIGALAAAAVLVAVLFLARAQSSSGS